MKNASGYWSADGQKVEFQDANWLYTTERLHIRYGIAPRAELYWIVKGHYLQLTNETLGTDTHGLYWGDPRFGWRFEVLRTAAPLTSVATVVEMKVPLGNEASGSYIAGPSSLQKFVTTTGTADLRLGVDGKRQLVGPLAAGGSLGYVYRFSNIVQYLLETENNQFHGRIKPGPQVYAEVNLMAQLGPIALSAAPGLEWHGPVAMGTTSSGLVPDRNLEIVEGSDGWSADVDVGVVANLTRNIDLVYGLNVPLRGEDLLFFPIEDIHPTYGLTHSATIELRY
ncbi:MAG: hypothetical protein H6741_16995 [Alphaproteobacteria bacterium]|nr:hypothetical protein [Alphaproteobacteria bacterium]MCB9794413.1 hypothetical protein [Alphaproteobacteria bacterium]